MASLPTPPAEHQQPVNKLPASSTFSFKAPFPASSSSSSTPASPLKHRRVSLALPSSPRLVQAWSFRDDTGIDSNSGSSNLALPEKKGKMRKIAPTAEDEDPTTFQEKKPRKKWSAEETQMLVDGCNRHGVGNWKTILSDPTLKFDSRSPVDLKDRFRTYFPDAYKQHYPNARTHLSSKVRSTLPDGSPLFEKTRSKRRRPFTEEEDRALKAGYEKHGTVWATIVKDPVFQDQNRRSTDLRDRFRNAFPELYQLAGYKPRTAAKKKNSSLLGDCIGMGQKRAATDDQLVMSTTGPVRSRRRAHTSQGLLRGGTKSVPQSTAVSEDEDSSGGEDESEASPAFKQPQIPVFVDNVSTVSLRTKRQPPSVVDVFTLDDDDEMEMVTIDQLSDPLTIPDFLPNQTHSEIEAQSQQPWSSGINTPTHSHNAWSTTAGSPTSSHISADFLMNQNQNTSSDSSPFLQQRSSGNGNGNNFGMIGKSAWGNDWFSPNPRLDPSSSTSASDVLSPASPFSFSHHLNHGVLDRYDLFPASMPHDFSSEVGVGDSHSTFSDEMFPPNGFRGFTHHSNYAGDLIFGARTYQPQSSNYYSSGFGFGLGLGGQGLGLSGIGQTAGIHPMQLHTPALPGIDEIELTGITLDDHADPLGVPLPPDAMDDDELDVSGVSSLPSSHNGLSSSLSSQSLPHTQQQQQQQQQQMQKDEPQEPSDRLCLDDIVDFSQELHLTPPATPLNHPRPLRRSSGSVLQHYPSANGGAPHARSISVPPSEARGANVNGNGRWRISPNGQPESSSLGGGSVSVSELSPFFQSSPAPSSSASSARSGRAPLPLPDFRPLTPTNTQHSHSQNSLLSTNASSPPPPPSMPMQHESWRSNMFANGNGAGIWNTVDMYDLPFLDLHYYYGGSMGNTSINGNNTLGFSGPAAGMDVAAGDRQGQALDLAQAAVSKPRQHVSDPPSVTVPASQGVPKQQGRSMSHHRGQSAVCPQDLMLRNDNKRKRASWDGGHG